MIRRRFTRKSVEQEVEPMGFDAFELRLGDLMRGERATLGKSLLDVERELRIKASYVAAIENCDPDAFDTPGFIPGYVRSYARYLGMDPDKAFTHFCAESGFSIAHGMSAEASSRRKSDLPLAASAPRSRDPFVTPNTPFVPASESLFARIEPGAIGSAFVLIGLIAAIGYGGWSVLNEVQRVTFAPVENTPSVLSDLDPLDNAVAPVLETADVSGTASGVFQPPQDRLDRLYRPQALDVPVMVARDAPISTLNPAEVGTLRPSAPVVADLDRTQQDRAPLSAGVQVVEGPSPEVMVVAVRPAWVRVRAADGSVIFESIMDAGDTYAVPATEEPPTLRVGESGAIYFAVNGQHYGPAGPRGSVTSGLELASATLTVTYEPAAPEADRDLSTYVASLQQPVLPQE